MDTKVEALQDNRTKVTVTVNAKDIDARIKRTYKDYANKYDFPGFRKGKAPRPVIDNALGKEAVLAAVTDDVVNANYPLALDEAGLSPIGKPDFDDPGLVEGGKPYQFSFTVEVKPELELSSYDPVEIELPAEGATDAEVDAQIDALREHYHTFEDASAATKVKADSFVDIAIKATDDAGAEVESLTTDDRQYGLGTGLMPAEFDEHLVGLKKGQSAKFTLEVSDDAPIMLAPVVGKTAKVNFEIEVKSVKKQVMPEVTDEWAKDTLGFKDATDLRERIVESIQQQKADILPRMKENACLNALAERVDAAKVPAGMVEESETSLIQDFFQQLQNQGMTFDAYLAQQNITPDQFKDDVKKQAADMAAQDLALDAWARHAGFKATDKEVAEEFKKAGAEDPAALMEQWRQNGQLHLVRQGVLRTKAILDVMEKAKVDEIDPTAKAKEAEKKPAKKAAAKKPAAKKTAKKDEDKADAAAQ